MFGYVTINKGELKIKEFDEYQSYYCGLCQSLKGNCGLWGQISLTYDLTFAAILLSSLYEPDNDIHFNHCIVHPFEKHRNVRNKYIDYAADMNVLLTYYKCEDDWKDDKSVIKKAYGSLLKKSLKRLKADYPSKVNNVSALLNKLSEAERGPKPDIDELSNIFGEIMCEILVYGQDEWADELTTLAMALGKYIYILDAYEDLAEDIKKGRFNPLISKMDNPDFEEDIHSVLMLLMAEAAEAFEMLPIVDNAQILRNILYSGVWFRYEAAHEKRCGNDEKADGGK